MADVTPKPSLILAEGAQFPQSVLQVSVPATDQLGGPPLDLLLFISVFTGAAKTGHSIHIQSSKC